MKTYLANGFLRTKKVKKPALTKFNSNKKHYILFGFRLLLVYPTEKNVDKKTVRPNLCDPLLTFFNPSDPEPEFTPKTR